MKIIDVVIKNARRRATLDGVVRRISHRFWSRVEDKNYDIALIGDRKAVGGLVKFADREQRNKIKRIISPRQIDKLVPGFKLKKDGAKDGIDLVVIPHQYHKKSIYDKVSKYLGHDIPIITMFEDPLIQHGSPENRARGIGEHNKLPEKTYIVASSRRTGSTMLCSFLKNTAVLGYPEEYIAVNVSVLAEHGMINPGYVLEEAIKTNQTPNGIFGIKINWSAFEQFNSAVLPHLNTKERELFENLLHNSAYIHLSRRNKIRQAISDWRAIGTGIFHIRKNSQNGIQRRHGTKLPYDYPRIKRHVIDFVKGDEGWKTFFKANNIHPLEIVYEDLVKHPEEEVTRVLDYLSVNCANPYIAPDTKMMSDGYTEEIYERFVKDMEMEFGKDAVKRLEGVVPVNDLSAGKGERKNHVLVTLATREYLDMAKQLFSSAYFNGGWDGDYLLLAHDVPDDELSWFTDRGILIMHTSPLYEGQPGGMHRCLADKFHMFTPYFRKWRTVVYSDLDAIIKESLEELKEVDGFYAVEDWSPTLTDQIVNDRDIQDRGLDPAKCREVIRKAERHYEMSRRPFCAGFFAFSTDIITDDMFDDLKRMMDEYQVVSKHGDQLSMNFFFYDRWKALSHTFNVLVAQGKTGASYRTGAHTRWGLAEDLSVYVLHIFNPKPWNQQSDYYWEWLVNLKRADQIGLCKVDKDFDTGIENIKRTESRIRLREKGYELIDRFFPFKGVSRRSLQYIYWRYITLRRIMRFIVVNADYRFIKSLLGKEQ